MQKKKTRKNIRTAAKKKILVWERMKRMYANGEQLKNYSIFKQNFLRQSVFCFFFLFSSSSSSSFSPFSFSLVRLYTTIHVLLVLLPVFFISSSYIYVRLAFHLLFATYYFHPLLFVHITCIFLFFFFYFFSSSYHFVTVP